MTLISVAGVWKLSLIPWLVDGEQANDGETSEIADDAEELAGGMERLANEVRAGQWKTLGEISKAIDR